MTAAVIFDFDGVLVDSEWVGNAQIAAYLTGAGHPTTTRQALDRFAGLSGEPFRAALSAWIGGPLPGDYAAARAAQDAQCMADGIDAVAGAVAFVERLPADLPIAIASSSRSDWIRRHLNHIGLAARFGEHVYSGREHVANGKPAPDLYLFAAVRLNADIRECVVIEDSIVGATGALASGARVIGLAAGQHCDAAHVARLREVGVREVADDFDELAEMLGLAFGDGAD